MKERIYLYKYRPDDLYTIKLLCEQRLHFSHPSEFNDPFDCNPPCSICFSEETFLSSIKELQPHLYEIAKNNSKALTASVNDDNDELKQEVQKIFNELYICCFSYNADSPAMWAHYCNNHTGLCLGFDKNIKGSYLEPGLTKIVDYVEKKQAIDLPNFTNEQIINAVKEKFQQWQYEEEIRIIKTPHQMIINGEWQNAFEKSALVAMFFGLRMPQERQDFYKLLCKQCGLNNVKFFKMTMPTDGTYHLIPQEIN